MKWSIKSQAALLGTALVLFFTSGCSTYSAKVNSESGPGPLYKQSNFQAAELQYKKLTEANKATKDAVIWRLERASVLRAAGRFEESNQVFNEAEDLINQFDEKAKISVTAEAGALFSNQANLDYTGRDYDKIMLSTYKALNYLQLGQKDKAGPELIRAFQRQQEAVDRNKKRIEKEEEEIKKANEDPKNAKARESSEKARNEPKVSAALSTNYTTLETLKPYADYVNPYTEYLNGIYFAHLGQGMPDLERSRKSFERTLRLVGENKFVKADFDMLDALSTSGGTAPMPAMTYVFFETGTAAYRDQFRIDIPLFIVDKGNIPYAGAAFPILKTDGDFMPYLTVQSDGTAENTVLISDMDTVVGQQLKDELPTIITKTILATTAKATAAYFVNKAVSDQSAIAGLFSKVLTAVAQASMNIADTRSWMTLPKQIQICRFITPKGDGFELGTPSGQKTKVTLEPDSVNLVFVKAVSASSPLLVSQVRLK